MKGTSYVYNLLHLKEISHDFWKEFFMYNMKMWNINKQNTINILNVYQILADIAEKELRMSMFLDTYQSLIYKRCLILK